MRIRPEKLLNAILYGNGKALLRLRAAQQLFFGWVANKRCFYQHGRHIGRAKDCEPRAFNLRLVQAINAAQLIQHGRSQLG